MVRYAPGLDLWADPLATLRRIQNEINHAFTDQRIPASAEFPAVNVWRGNEGVVVTAEVPGVRLEDMELTVHQNTLTLKGRLELEAKEPDVSFHRRERVYGPFARTVSLPFAVDPEQVKATTENGVLKVVLPRPESDKPRKIQIAKG
jgi:HSP20 family protein